MTNKEKSEIFGVLFWIGIPFILYLVFHKTDTKIRTKSDGHEHITKSVRSFQRLEEVHYDRCNHSSHKSK